MRSFWPTPTRTTKFHPAYVTKLFLSNLFRYRSAEIYGKPDEHTFEINTIDYNQPTCSCRWAMPSEHKYKIINYEEKNKKDDSGIDHDVSELTIQNTEDGHKVVLVVGLPTNDPDSYAASAFSGRISAGFRGEEGRTFTLEPEPDVTYKLIDIQADHATIQNTKTNQEITIPLIKGKEVFRAPDGKLWGADAKR